VQGANNSNARQRNCPSLKGTTQQQRVVSSMQLKGTSKSEESSAATKNELATARSHQQQLKGTSKSEESSAATKVNQQQQLQETRGSKEPSAATAGNQQQLGAISSNCRKPAAARSHQQQLQETSSS
jgi:hypothetical protein